MMAERRQIGEAHLSGAIERGKAENLVLVERTGPNHSIAMVTLNRPRALNAINTFMWLELTKAMQTLPRDGSVRAVILQGAGRSFSQGSDLAEIREIAKNDMTIFPPEKREEEGINAGVGFFGIAEDALRSIEEFPFDVIAKERGYTLGLGLELTLACDYRIADTTLRVGVPAAEKDIMLPPDHIRRFFFAIGISNTTDILSTGDIYESYEDALRLRVVNTVVQPAELDEAAMQLALKKAKQAPEAVMARKYGLQLCRKNPSFTMDDIDPRIAYAWAGSENLVEGLDAHFEKREPQFKLMKLRDDGTYR